MSDLEAERFYLNALYKLRDENRNIGDDPEKWNEFSEKVGAIVAQAHEYPCYLIVYGFAFLVLDVTDKENALKSKNK